ncbi:MAG: FlgD immunoglobulin-like domain containing protein [bacterium]
MSPAGPGDSLYVVNLPSQIDQTHLRFYVRATDNMGASTTYPGDAPQGAYCCFVGIAPISTIQWVEMGDDTSYVMGQARNVTGIVTAGRGVYKDNLFVVQDASGPWSGIYVYDPSYSLPAETGDSVTIAGKVIEYYGLTELMVIGGCYEEHSSGHTLPAPVEIPTGNLSTGSAFAESYEGVLVKVDSVSVTNEDLGYGEWEINDGSGACIVDDEAYYFYNPRNGDLLESITGVVYYSYGTYKIEPRGDDDIVGPPLIYSLRFTPHAPRPIDTITLSCIVKGVHPITSVKLYYSTNGGASFDSTAMAGVDSVYTAEIGPYSDGTVVDYYVQVWDENGLTGRKPASGTYDLRVGMNTIYDVQYVPEGGDSSSFAGKPVNVAGIVTAGTGEYSNNYFYIQNSYGLGSPAFMGVKIYDRTGTVVVSRGDSVTVSGDVLEYYGETEIAMFFPEAITIHSGGNQVPPPYSVSPTQVNTEEAWEGVLVSLSGVEVVDPDAGFGEWIVGSIVSPSDTCRVGDYGSYTYVPTLGEDFGYINGICNYAYGLRMIQPRDDDDICAASEAGIGTEERFVMFVRPNPTFEGVTVKLILPEPGNISLKIYNVQGALVKTVSSGRFDAGSYTVPWDGRNQDGERVTSGVYFVRLEAPAGKAVTKIVVTR